MLQYYIHIVTYVNHSLTHSSISPKLINKQQEVPGKLRGTNIMCEPQLLKGDNYYLLGMFKIYVQHPRVHNDFQKAKLVTSEIRMDFHGHQGVINMQIKLDSL